MTLLIVASTFVGTLVVVCVIALVLLSKRRAEPKRAVRRGTRLTPARVGYGPRPAADVGDKTRTLDPQPVGAGRRTPVGVMPVLLALVMTLAVALGVIYAVVKIVGHLDALSFLFRGVPAVPERFLWAVPQALAAAVLAIGLPLARRFRRPERFRTGVVLLGIAFATFLPLQYLAAIFDVPFWEYRAVLHGLAFFISVCLLSGGLETMRRASNTPHDDSWEFWRASP